MKNTATKSATSQICNTLWLIKNEMTAQARERLIYRGKTFGMDCEPFSQYVIKNNLELRLRAPNTALWRGYFGEWEIMDTKLFLTRISGNGEIKDLEKFRLGKLDLRKQMKEGKITPQQNGQLLKFLEKDCFEEIELSLKNLFNSETKVFADWYSGKIRCPYGDIIQYGHMGYGSLYSNELLINIIEGIIRDVKDIKNQLPPKIERPSVPPPLPHLIPPAPPVFKSIPPPKTVIELVIMGQIYEAVMLHKKTFGVSLKESKDYIDILRKK